MKSTWFDMKMEKKVDSPQVIIYTEHSAQKNMLFFYSKQSVSASVSQKCLAYNCSLPSAMLEKQKGMKMCKEPDIT